MQIGDMVKIKRASVGIPLDTVGLIVNIIKPTPSIHYDDLTYYVVQIVRKEHGVLHRRYLERDLEVVSASR